MKSTKWLWFELVVGVLLFVANNLGWAVYEHFNDLEWWENAMFFILGVMLVGWVINIFKALRKTYTGKAEL